MVMPVTGETKSKGLREVTQLPGPFPTFRCLFHESKKTACRQSRCNVVFQGDCHQNT